MAKGFPLTDISVALRAAPSGSASSPSIGFGEATGWYLASSGVMGLALLGVAAAGIDSAGDGVAAATDTSGIDLFIRAPSAGASAASPRAGGNVGLGGGTGSAGSGTVAGGDGGGAFLYGAAGGAKAGTGHAGGGTGAPAGIQTGAGGATASNGSDAGGDSGAIQLVCSAGGAATAGTGNGGNAGGLEVYLGSGGASAGGTAGQNGEFKIGVGTALPGTSSFQVKVTSVSVTSFIHTACRPIRITGIYYVSDAAGTVGTPTAAIRKCPSGTAPGSGVLVTAAADSIALTQTANSSASVTLSSTLANLILAAGDSLAISFTGTLTTVVGMVTICWGPQ